MSGPKPLVLEGDGIGPEIVAATRRSEPARARPVHAIEAGLTDALTGIDTRKPDGGGTGGTRDMAHAVGRRIGKAAKEKGEP